jgi:hypothetical protein
VNYRRLLIAAALAGAAAMPADAAPVPAANNASGRALILVPLTLTKIDDLEFGSVIPTTVSGTVMINASTGARTFTGGVTGVPSDTGNRAYFGGGGSPSQQVIVWVTPPAELTSTTNASDKIPVLTLTLDGSPVRTINATTRTFFFGVGGIIQINANQPEGVYQAIFEVTAIYL